MQSFDMQITAGKSSQTPLLDLIKRKFKFLNFCFASHKLERIILLKIFNATVKSALLSPEKEQYIRLYFQKQTMFNVYILIGLDSLLALSSSESDIEI